MKTIIHVFQARIRKNIKVAPDQREPPIIVRNGKKRAYGSDVEIRDADGTVLARFVYRPDRPLDCGARLWVESDKDVVVVG